MARKFYAFPAGSGIEIKLDPTLVTPGAKISEDEIRALVPPGTYVFGSADDAIEVVKADTPPLAMLTPPSLTGSLRIGGEAAISPGTFTPGASVSHVLVYQDAGTDVVIATGVTSFIWTAADDGRAVRVVTTATLGAATLVVASPSPTVAYNAPTTSGALLDVAYTEDTGDKMVDASGAFAVVGDPRLAGVTWSVTGTGATISSAGVVTITTAEARAMSPVAVTATNSGGSVSSTLEVTVVPPVAPVDLTIQFGALTPTDAGGAQARDASGKAVSFTSINSQPSTRWTLSGGKLVATGSPAMASEQITATVAGRPVKVSIVVVPNMISVASLAEFNAVSMTPAGTGDFTIHLRAGVDIPKTNASAKISGTSSASRVLGGRLTLTGELVNGLPAANVRGINARYFSGGTIALVNINTNPLGDLPAAEDFDKIAHAMLQFDESPSTDVLIEGVHAVLNPTILEWPGITADNGTNDWGFDEWGACVRVNAVSGVSRRFADGSSVDGPDIITFSGSGVKRPLLGIRAVGGGVYDLQLGDHNAAFYNLNTSDVSTANTGSIGLGNVGTGLGGFTCTVIARPAGVEAAGGRISGAAAFTYQKRSAIWLGTPNKTGSLGDYTDTVRNLTIRNCDISCGGGDGMIRPACIDTALIEQNKFHHFTADCIKIPNKAGSNFRLIIRRNDIYSAMAAPSDLGAVHVDYIQIWGVSGSYWDGLRMHHNRFLCNARGCGQGMFNTSGTNALRAGQIFGNIFIMEKGGQGISQNMASDSIFAHNTYIINHKHPSFVPNTKPGGGQVVNAASSSPGTNLYSGWNIAREYSLAGVKTQKNFGINGNTSKLQLEMVAGLGGDRPLFFNTFEDLMTGAATILTGGDAKAGAISPVTDWSQYPYRVTTDDAHLPFRLDYEPGDLS